MRTSRIVLLVAVLLSGPALHAQTSAPQTSTPEETALAPPLLRVDFPETEAVPGQFLSLRLTVLVPGFMPEPPVWPSLEAPNLLVRVAGTSPVSERIDGDTWSGVSRRYRISPMVPGGFELPSQEIVVTVAASAADEPVRTTLSTDPLAFSGVVPAGAEGLDPFLAASDLTLTQEISGDPAAMVPGDSVTRTIAANVTGVSPMFLPALLAPDEVPGLAAYPDEPVIEERENRGDLSGTRQETVTYLAESGGSGTLAAIELEWFDIDTGTIETARVEEVEVAVEGPPAVLTDPEGRRRIAMLTVAGVALAACLALGLRLILPPLRRRASARRAARLASEDHAWHALTRVIARRDEGALHPALDTWAVRFEGPDPRRAAEVQDALAALGRARYGAGSGPAVAPDDAWRALDAALRAARRQPAAATPDTALPPLNPGATA